MELTHEQQVAQDYKAALDSVALLEAGKPADITDEEWADCKQRNIDHLKIQLEKGAEYYGSNDLIPFENAVKL
jgi:hypothetical protein